MASSNRGRLRRIWFQVHLWIGVALSLALIPLGISGSYLVWRDEIERLMHPDRYQVSAGPAALPASAYLAAAQGGFGERARAASLRMPARPGDPVVVTGQVRRAQPAPGAAPARAPERPQSLTAWIDPPDGRVLAVANPRQGLSAWMHDLHGQFFVFGTGRQVVGWFGWAMLVSCLTGLWLWWPQAGGPLMAVRWRRSAKPLMNWHHFTGFWMVLPLAALSLSGALIAFPDFTRAAVSKMAPVSGRAGGPPRGRGGPIGHSTLTPDQAVALARAQVPSARLTSLTLPTRSKEAPAWRIQLKGASGGPVDLVLPDQAGAAPRVAPPPVLSQGDGLIRFNRRLHDGDDGPALWKWIITLAGLAPAILGVTGTIAWAAGLKRAKA